MMMIMLILILMFHNEQWPHTKTRTTGAYFRVHIRDFRQSNSNEPNQIDIGVQQSFIFFSLFCWYVSFRHDNKNIMINTLWTMKNSRTTTKENQKRKKNDSSKWIFILNTLLFFCGRSFLLVFFVSHRISFAVIVVSIQKWSVRDQIGINVGFLCACISVCVC